jgi:hypothetical protein
MGKIHERLPVLLSAGTLLTGAMLFGASLSYTYSSLNGVVYANACEELNCNPDDPDDCPGEDCNCNDDLGMCRQPTPPLS